MGLESSFLNEEYEKAGAIIKSNFKENPPSESEITDIPQGATLVGNLSVLSNQNKIKEYANANINALSIELIPRISRAQSMDILSSQSNLAGYKSVICAANLYGRSFPMMMTAAGTIPPAKVLILGAGVAGLQAMASEKS